MTIKVNQKQLANSLTFAGKILKSKNTIPAFGMFALATTENILHIRAVTDEMGIYTQCPAQCEGGVKMAVMGNDFLKLIKSLKGEITLSVEEKLDVITDSGKYSIPLEPYDEMPTQDINNATSLFKIDSIEFSEALTAAASCVSQDELRPIMQTIHCNTENDEIVGTDSTELIVFPFKPFEKEETHQQVNISTLTQRALSGLEDTITVKKSNNLYVFDNGKHKIVQRAIEGQFPKYSAVIPQDNPINVIVERDALVDALRRLRNVANTASMLVVLNISEGQIKLKSEDLDFNKAGEETIAATVNGGDITIGFNTDKLINLLKSRYTNTLTLEFSDHSRPLVCNGEDNITSILMPLMVG